SEAAEHGRLLNKVQTDMYFRLVLLRKWSRARRSVVAASLTSMLEMPLYLSAALVLLLLATGCSRNSQDYVRRGNSFFSEHKYDDAALQYRRALQNNPNYGEAIYQLGLVSLEQNKFADAYPLLTRAVEAMPQNDEAKAKLADTTTALYVTDPTHPRAMYDQ